MKKRGFFCFFLITIIGCQVNQKPEFRGVSNVSIQNIATDKISLLAEAVFFNPNDISYELVGSEIEVFVNNKSISKTSQKHTIPIEPNQEFTIPIKADFNLKTLLSGSENIVNSIIKNVINKAIDTKFIGKISVKKAGLILDIPFEHTQQIKL